MKNVEQPPNRDMDEYVIRQRFELGKGQGRIELLQDKRISISVFNNLWRAGGIFGTSDAQLRTILAGGPLRTARLRLTFCNTCQAQTRDIGYPLATLTALDDSGEAFSVHVDTTDERASRIAEEKLIPALHGLTPPA